MLIDSNQIIGLADNLSNKTCFPKNRSNLIKRMMPSPSRGKDNVSARLIDNFI